MPTTIAAKDVAELRARTQAGMMDCKKALEETGGDMEKAVDLLKKRGIAKAEKRAGRSAAQGIIGSYVHHDGRYGVLVELNCETDFVARTEDFRGLARDLAMHIASANPVAVDEAGIPAEMVAREKAIFAQQVAESGKPENVRTKMVEGKLKKFFAERVLLQQPFVKDDKMTVGDLVKSVSGTVGENVVVRRFVRYELGEAGAE
jgi:elongation factor Ts